jgi:hypothetical protein
LIVHRLPRARGTRHPHRGSEPHVHEPVATLPALSVTSAVNRNPPSRSGVPLIVPTGFKKKPDGTEE